MCSEHGFLAVDATREFVPNTTSIKSNAFLGFSLLLILGAYCLFISFISISLLKKFFFLFRLYR